MSYQATVFNIMISCPSDIVEEKNIIKEVIDEWNNTNSETNKKVLLPIYWKSSVSPEMYEPAQMNINKTILKNCDLLIAIFGTKVGTPTDEHPSGTIEEIEKNIEVGRPTLIYFSEKKINPLNENLSDIKKIKKFKEQYMKKGIIDSFSDENDLKGKFAKHLQITINKDEHFKISEPINYKQDKTNDNIIDDSLSDEAKELLKEASLNGNGEINIIDFEGGSLIYTNGKSFGENDGRELAKWYRGLAELEEKGLISTNDSNHKYFKLTYKGYNLADSI